MIKSESLLDEVLFLVLQIRIVLYMFLSRGFFRSVFPVK